MTLPANSPGAERGRMAGFTLLEVIIVIAILGLVAGIVAGRGPSRSRGLDDRSAIADVVRMLRMARGLAIATDLPVMVAVNGEKRTVSVTGGRTLHVPPEFTVTAAGATAALPTGKLVGIRFHPTGSSSGGRILLADGARHVQVGVDWLTGKISVTDAK